MPAFRSRARRSTRQRRAAAEYNDAVAAGAGVLFAFHDEKLSAVPFLCVDGVVEGGLNLSHWPGNRTPARLKADTTTEMALKLARDPAREEWLSGVRVVTNNHFDTDGLLSAWGVLFPGEAVRHERALVRAARTGDFGEYTTPEAFKFDAVVTAFDDDARSPIAPRLRGLSEHERYQTLYDHLLGLMPGLLDEAPRYKDLWTAPLQALTRALMRIRDVARLREHDAARLTVIEASEPLDQMARFNVARHHRVLTATRSDDGLIYEMAFQVYSWFETVTPARGTRLDLTPAAAALNQMEPGGRGRWIYTGNDSLEARLYRAGAGGEPVASALPLETVASYLLGLFDGRP